MPYTQSIINAGYSASSCYIQYTRIQYPDKYNIYGTVKPVVASYIHFGPLFQVAGSLRYEQGYRERWKIGKEWEHR